MMFAYVVPQPTVYPGTCVFSTTMRRANQVDMFARACGLWHPVDPRVFNFYITAIGVIMLDLLKVPCLRCAPCRCLCVGPAFSLGGVVVDKHRRGVAVSVSSSAMRAGPLFRLGWPLWCHAAC